MEPNPSSDGSSSRRSSSLNDDGASTSNLPTASPTRHPPINLTFSAETLEISTLPDFFEHVRLNVYAAIRILLTEIEMSRLEALREEISGTYIQASDIYNAARELYFEACITYQGQTKKRDKTFKFLSLCAKRLSTVESMFLGMERVYGGAMKRHDKLFQFHEDAIKNGEGKKRIRRLRHRIQKARIHYVKSKALCGKLQRMWKIEKGRRRAAYREYKKVDKMFKNTHSKTFMEARRRHDLAYQEFQEKKDTYLVQLVALIRAYAIVRFEHENGILRTVPLLPLNNWEEEDQQEEQEQVEEEEQAEEDQQEEGQQEEQQEPEPASPENNIDWENLIYLTVELVIEVRTVTRMQF